MFVLFSCSVAFPNGVPVCVVGRSDEIVYFPWRNAVAGVAVASVVTDGTCNHELTTSNWELLFSIYSGIIKSSYAKVTLSLTNEAEFDFSSGVSKRQCANMFNTTKEMSSMLFN